MARRLSLIPFDAAMAESDDFGRWLIPRDELLNYEVHLASLGVHFQAQLDQAPDGASGRVIAMLFSPRSMADSSRSCQRMPICVSGIHCVRSTSAGAIAPSSGDHASMRAAGKSVLTHIL
ncbi:hypothetical protein DAB18_37675 [Bradyrhizobium sp. WBAH41]|nr:hypothetical protein DAB18_37675 [Bradyrhizobium sp. WBAH41]